MAEVVVDERSENSVLFSSVAEAGEARNERPSFAEFPVVAIKLPSPDSPGKYWLFVRNSWFNAPFFVGADTVHEESQHVLTASLGDEVVAKFSPAFPFMLIPKGSVQFLSANEFQALVGSGEIGAEASSHDHGHGPLAGQIMQNGERRGYL